MMDKIVIKGAREHNLKDISVELPREKFILITGLSGSGKSTLAFDTLYAEGQRRYVESLSAYARQFLGLMNKPDVDSIEGLSPAISIEQKSTSKNPRSTVGTVTEIYDYLRLLFARIGVAHCPKCGKEIKSQSAENIVNLLITETGTEKVILAPIIRGQKGLHDKIMDDLKKDGYVRARIDGKIYRLDEQLPKLARYEKHWIEAVIDRIKINEDTRLRLNEGVEHALKKGEGTMIIVSAENSDKQLKEIERSKIETVYSTYGACPNHPEVVFETPEPRMFSFNSPFGACPGCNGLGEKIEISPELIVPDNSKTILEGAIKVYGAMDISWRARDMARAGRKHGFTVTRPLSQFTKKQMRILLYGDESIDYEGVIPQSMRLHRETDSEHRKEFFEKFMVGKTCNVCGGKRLKEDMLSIMLDKKSIIDVTDLNIDKEIEYFKSLPKKLTEKDLMIARQVLKEINARLGFLQNVGLGYLTLSRAARTLSGGEAQRIRLATQIGSNLTGVMYILDEPSIGLHQRDNQKLIDTLKNLRDIGNTLIVVEHDEDTIRAADHVIDMGPGAGVHGGHIVAQGTPKEIEKSKKSITGQYLSGTKKIEVPNKRRKPAESITIKGAKENNLKNVEAKLPTQVLCCITGVSGSGKSSLMNQTLIPAVKNKLTGSTERTGEYSSLKIPETIKNVIVIDQDPIGRTPRSNPATYTKVFDEIRKLFASTREARMRGYNAGRFSFNVRGGRCETCRGDGMIKIEMNFLPDVYVTCEDCKGKRYNKETLDVTYREKNISDVLEMSVEEALAFFENHPGIKRKMKTLNDVGLGYIKLGQSATTLSGGESQRIKLTRELAKMKRGETLYLLDEPTTGLHFDDVSKLIKVLNRLVDKGNSIFVIEHNLDVIKSADYIIDLGPEGGDGGGTIIAEGTPEQVSKVKGSHTGKFLKHMLK